MRRYVTLKHYIDKSAEYTITGISAPENPKHTCTAQSISGPTIPTRTVGDRAPRARCEYSLVRP